MDIIEVFSYDFMIRAFIIGVLSTVLTAVLGNFLVASRQSMISDMLAHTSLAGVGMGIFFHISPYWMAMVIAIIGSTLLFFFTRGKKHPPEAISMMLLTGGIAIALLFSHLAKDNPIALKTFLFGSILTTTWEEIFLFAGIFVVGMFFLFFFWNRIVGICFDSNFVRSQFQKSWLIEWFFFMLLAIVVALSLKTIGALLVGALLVIPTLTAQLFSKNFLVSVIMSIILNSIGVFSGILLSFYFDVPTSSTVVLTLIGIFLLGNLGKILWKGYPQ